MDRRMLLGFGANLGASLMAGVALCGTARAAPPLPDVTYLQDFDELWETLRARYCFFAEKRTDWEQVRRLYRPMALAAPSREAFAEVVGRVLAELYDAHTHLSDPADDTPRWPPYDLLVEPQGSAARIVAVKEGSAAQDAGLRTGDTIAAVDGRPVSAAMRDALPRCLTGGDAAADLHALNVALAGRRGLPRRLTLVSGRDVDLPLKAAAQRPDVEWRRLDGGAGYIAIRSFGDDEAARQFDKALADLRETPGLVIDVRDNGGGDTAVARPIMGRFITEPKPYATMRRREGPALSAPWTESVDPSGPFTYARPVVVLANHWSGSMAEGFPMGMRAVAGARIVGTRMMGLGAAVIPIRLDRTGLQAQYSAEPVYDVTGKPRWLLEPDVTVPEGGDILAAGLAELRCLVG